MSIQKTISRLLACGLIGLCAAFAHAQTPPNVRLNTDNSPFLQNEEQVWINLTDSLNVVADWRDFRLGYRRVGVGRSTDGGATWTDQLLQPLIFTWQSDPLLVGNNNGKFFLNVLDFDNGVSSASHVVLYTSTNGGLFWTGPVPMQPLGPYFEDKQFSAVDRTGGPYNGNYYCSWTRFPDAGPDRMIFVRSTDGGVSFNDTIAVGPALLGTKCGTWDQGQFSIPIVGSNGKVHVFWQGVHLDSTGGTCQGVYSAIRHNVSIDGGASFLGDTVAFFPNLTYATVDGSIDVYGMPNGDADISGGPFDGTIYISETQFADLLGEETDVQVRRSTDDGVTWSAPSTVNDDLPGQNIDQFHPWLYVNEDGVVVMVFYDQRNDPINHYLFDSYFAASFDGGETFTTNYRLSSVSSSPSFLAESQERKLPLGPTVDRLTGLIDPGVSETKMAGRIAEYIAIHAKHDYNVAVWTDTRDGTQDVYSTHFVTPFLRPRLYDPPAGYYSSDSSVAFRWSTCWHQSEDSYRLEISSDSTFASGVTYVPGLTSPSYTSAPFTGAQRYWRVKAFRTAGDSTAYSVVRDFYAACAVAATPSLTSPTAADTLDHSNTVLGWTPVIGALSYHVQMSNQPSFVPLLIDSLLAANSVTIASLPFDSTHYYWRVNATNGCGTGAFSSSDFYLFLCPIHLTGDLNMSGTLTSGDIILLVNYVFKSGAPPLPVPEAGDVDCSHQVNSADIIKMVNHLFKSGPPPCDACTLL